MGADWPVAVLYDRTLRHGLPPLYSRLQPFPLFLPPFPQLFLNRLPPASPRRRCLASSRPLLRPSSRLSRLASCCRPLFPLPSPSLLPHRSHWLVDFPLSLIHPPFHPSQATDPHNSCASNFFLVFICIRFALTFLTFTLQFPLNCLSIPLQHGLELLRLLTGPHPTHSSGL